MECRASPPIRWAISNLYPPQFFDQADADIGPLSDAFRRGEFQPLLEWLRANIHQQGQRFTATELVSQVTGRPLSQKSLLDSLRRKYGDLHGIAWCPYWFPATFAADSTFTLPGS